MAVSGQFSLSGKVSSDVERRSKATRFAIVLRVAPISAQSVGRKYSGARLRKYVWFSTQTRQPILKLVREIVEARHITVPFLESSQRPVTANPWSRVGFLRSC